MTYEKYFGFDIVIPGKYKINSSNILPSPDELDIDYIGKQSYREDAKIINIRGISYEQFEEVCENPDILIIKKD